MSKSLSFFLLLVPSILLPSSLMAGLDDDLDFDGLIGSEEAAYGTDEFDADTDDDGISDGEEVSLGLIPDDADSDNDLLSDGLEIGKTTPIPGGDGYVGTDAFWVPDSDPGTTTDPLDQDTDDDGVVDGQEDFNNNGFVDFPLGETDPVDADTDDDGLNDREYSFHKTFPNISDTDLDGLNDGLELGKTIPIPGGTSDGPVSVRVAYLGTAGSWTTDADAGATTTDPLDADSDGDGLCDGGITVPGFRGYEDDNANGQIDAGESDPNSPDPFISITRSGNDVTVEYVGTIQESTALSGWTDMDPQPDSPFTFTLSAGEKRFFQIAQLAPAAAVTVESAVIMTSDKKTPPGKSKKNKPVLQ